MPKRVAVVGAGPSGMVTLRRFAEDPANFQAVGFEINREVGGLWNYSDNTDKDEFGLPCFSSIYKTLKINFPKEMMGYRDHDFPQELPSFVKHVDVKNYLDEYAKKYELNKYIRFQTIVTNVKPTTPSSRDSTWQVTSRELKSNTEKTEEYDIVLVCIGSDANANIPEIPGSTSFKGRLLHSKNYRDPAHYKDETVVVVGGSFSALDLMVDLSPSTKKMYVAHRNKEPFKFKLPEKVEQVACVVEILPNGVKLSDGKTIDCDTIILATGYFYNFPFISEECGLNISRDCVRPLYRHMINPKYPTLCFIDLITRVLKMKLSDIQAQYLRGVFRNEIQVPSEEEMRKVEAADYQKRVVDAGQTPKMYHDMIEDQWDYTTNMANEAKCPRVSDVDRKLFAHLLKIYEWEFPSLKGRTYKLIGDTDFEETL